MKTLMINHKTHDNAPKMLVAKSHWYTIFCSEEGLMKTKITKMKLRFSLLLMRLRANLIILILNVTVTPD